MMERDIAGALGLHKAEEVQYETEILRFVPCAFLSALTFKEFRPIDGSSPFIRFILGVFPMTGALVFLGCPWSTLLRLAGGDGNAIFGLLGLIFLFFVWIGTRFLKAGYSLGKTQVSISKAIGLDFSLLIGGLILLHLIDSQLEGEARGMFISYILKGLASQFNLSFEKLLLAHSMQAWNFLGMTLAGLAFNMAG